MPKFAIGAAVALAVVVMLAAQPTAAGANNPFDHIVPLVQVGEPLPATHFVDQRGAPLRLSELRGKAVAVAFVYTRCRDACPIIMRKFGQVRALLGDAPVALVEVTIDPQNDTLPAIAAYAKEYDIQAPAWLVLTGAPADVDDFGRRMGVQSIRSGRDEIVHNDRVALVGPDGLVADFIDGSSWTPADLAAELKHLAGRRASAIERFDLALGAAVAFCGGALSGRSGIGDLLASIAVLGAAAWFFFWLARRMAAAHS